MQGCNLFMWFYVYVRLCRYLFALSMNWTKLLNLADENNFFEKKKSKYKKKTETLYKICKSSKQRNIIYLDVKLT